MRYLVAILMIAFAVACASPQVSDPSPEIDAPASTLSTEEQAAVEQAQSYLQSVGGFSRSGLIDQLEFEGFSTEVATVAVDSLNVDWNKQAEKSARSYIDSIGGFSRSELIEQLEFEGFTHEQAVHGAEANGYLARGMLDRPRIT